MINLYEPKIYKEDIELVIETINKGWLSGNTPIINEFEENISNYLENRYSLLCSNGTLALHLALLSIGIEKDDEVIVPSLSYIASANAVKYIGAKPVFVDVNFDDWQIDIGKIKDKISSKTKAIMPVHLYGLAPDLDSIQKISEDYKLKIVHDAAEALGTKYKDKHTSSYKDVAIHSFFPNKVITTGEGGLLTTNNEEIYLKAKKIRSQGLRGEVEYDHDVIGYNYRISAVLAALGLNQIGKIDTHVNDKEKIFNLYKSRLEEHNFIFPEEKKEIKSSFWLISCLVPENINRDDLKEFLYKKQIDTRNVFKPIHLQEPYIDKNVSLPNSEKISNKGICLPSSPDLTSDQINYICDQIIFFLKK